MASEMSLSEVIRFYRKHWKEGSFQNPQAATKDWTTSVQSKVSDYAASLMEAAQPHRFNHQQEYDRLVMLCEELLVQFEHEPVDPYTMRELHEAIEALGDVSEGFKAKVSLLDKPDELGEPTFWKEILKFAKNWKDETDEWVEEAESKEKVESRYAKEKQALLENLLGPVGPLVRVGREFAAEYKDLLSDLWLKSKRRFRFLRTSSVWLKRFTRKIKHSFLRVLKWLLRPLKSYASRLWNRLKGWGSKLFGKRFGKGKAGLMSRVGDVFSKVVGSPKMRFGLATAGVAALAAGAAHAKPAAIPDTLPKPDPNLEKLELDASTPEFVPSVPVSKYLPTQAEKKQWRDEADSPEGPFSFEQAQHAAPAARADKVKARPLVPAEPKRAARPAQSAANEQEELEAALKKGEKEFKADLGKQQQNHDKAAGKLQAVLDDQASVAKDGSTAQLRQAYSGVEKTDKASIPNDTEMKKQESQEGGFFSRMWNLLTGKVKQQQAAQERSSRQSQQKPVSYPQPAHPKRSGSGDGADTGAGAPKTLEQKAAATQKSGGVDSATIAQGKKATHKASSSVDLDRVNPGFMRNFYAMVGEYNAKTGRRVQVNSGFRSKEHQAALRAKYGSRAAPPGLSMHEFGYAIDINSSSGNELSNMGLLQKYGFVRPVRGEPWHLEQSGTQGKKAQIRAGANVAIEDKTGGQAETQTSASSSHGEQPEQEVPKQQVQKEQVQAKQAVDQAKVERREQVEQEVRKEASPVQAHQTIQALPTPATPQPVSYIPAGRQEILSSLNVGKSVLAKPSAVVSGLASSGIGDDSAAINSVRSQAPVKSFVPQSIKSVVSSAGVQPLADAVQSVANTPEQLQSTVLSQLHGLQSRVMQQPQNILNSILGNLKLPDSVSQALGSVDRALSEGQGLLSQVQSIVNNPTSVIDSLSSKLGLNSMSSYLQAPADLIKQQIDPVVRPIPETLATIQADAFKAVESVGATLDKTIDLPANAIKPAGKQSFTTGSVGIADVPLFFGDMAFLHLNLGVAGR